MEKKQTASSNYIDRVRSVIYITENADEMVFDKIYTHQSSLIADTSLEVESWEE